LWDASNDKANRPDAGPNFMIISCPECAAKFLVDAAALGATGRMVRCGKCAHTWPETPPETVSDDVSATADDEAPAPSEPPPDPEIDDDEFPESDSPFDQDFEPGRDGDPASTGGEGYRTGIRAGVPALPRKRKSIVARITWFLLILLILGSAGGGVFFQNQIIKAWPVAKRLYDMAGLIQEPLGVGLNLVNVKFSQQSAKGAGLLVQGEVENISDHVLDVPGLRATLFDKEKKAVQRWPFKAPLPRLLPGENVKFRTIIKNPAKGAARIEIDFHETHPK
jgi:predicted Zn finger-like uncharacterized protein